MYSTLIHSATVQRCVALHDVIQSDRKNNFVLRDEDWALARLGQARVRCTDLAIRGRRKSESNSLVCFVTEAIDPQTETVDMIDSDRLVADASVELEPKGQKASAVLG